MIYKIEGIKNLIEWDGLNPPKVLRNHGKGYLRPFSYAFKPGQLLFQPMSDDGKVIRVSRGRILFMLRHGVSLRQCREFNVSYTDDGNPRDMKPRQPAYTIFRTIAECEKTISVIKSLIKENPVPLYEHINSEKEFLKFTAARHYGISRQRFDFLFDETLRRVEQQLTECNFMYLRKINIYFIRMMFTLHKTTRFTKQYEIDKASQDI